MAKGETCPNCGESTWHGGEEMARSCACGAVGWHAKDKLSGGAGTGKQCPDCNSRTLKKVAKNIRRCTNCELVCVYPADV